MCKYVITPGGGERLQTGQNPIRVNINAIPARPVVVGAEFSDRHGRSLVIAFDVGQPDPTIDDCPPPSGGGTTTTTASTTTTTGPGGTTTTTTQPGGTTTTTVPTPGQFSFSAVVAVCPEGEPLIAITFPSRPDLNGETGTLTFSTGGSVPLTFISGQTVHVPYPDTTADVTLTYTLVSETGTETATATVGFPADCPVVTTTTVPGATTTTVLPGTPRPQTPAPADPAQAQPTSAQAADDGGLASTGGSIAALATVAILLTAGGALIHRRLNR